MPKSTSVQNLKFFDLPFQINQKGSPNLQIWPLGLYHTPLGDILSSALPYPVAGLRRRKSAGRWKEEREDETWEGGKVRIGGLVSSIPGEKRELPPVTGG